MPYLLDANAVIGLLNKTDSVLLKKLQQYKPSEVSVSSIVIHELYYGAFKSKRAANNVVLVDELQFEVLEFTKDDARAAGEIRAQLAIKGTPIGPYDVLIAGQAKSRDATLVTQNLKEFGRVPGLRVVNWSSQL